MEIAYHFTEKVSKYTKMVAYYDNLILNIKIKRILNAKKAYWKCFASNLYLKEYKIFN